jgi:membrane associated rhomboid family serine protease
MSSIFDPSVAQPLGDTSNASPDHAVDRLFATDYQPMPPSSVSWEERLRSIVRWTPVTWVLVVVNVVLFAAMAITYGRLFRFSQDALLTWGGGLAPRVFGQQWWRAGTYMFVHSNLAHLASNLLFLLLIAPLMERLLGPFRIALVYLLAGLGGGLLMMGTYPQDVVVGASAAVYGVYGALLGCYLRGPRSIPWRLVAERDGLLLLYTVVTLLVEWLDFARQPVGHLGGFVFGLVGGFLCGYQLQPRSVRWRLLHLSVIVSVCVSLIGLTAGWVNRCAAKALAYYERYAAAKDRERTLLGRFNDALHQWEQGKLTSAEWKRVLDKSLIPAWEDTRSSCGLKLTGKLAELEKHSFTMQDFWNALRSLRSESKTHDDKPLTAKEYGKMYCLLGKVRLDTWRALANDLPGNRLLMVRTPMDLHELEVLFAGLDDEVNEDNPLYRWFELTRKGRRPARKEAVERDLGLLKNGGFEGGLEGWTTYTLNHPAQFEFDTDVTHKGRTALRVTATQPSNTGCYQDVMLEPGQWYQFSGWVRTRGLVPHGATLWGTFSICHGGSNDRIALADSHSGDTEWTQVSIRFRAPAGGLTRIYVHFSGWAPATGTAWFADLKLVEISQPAQ